MELEQQLAAARRYTEALEAALLRFGWHTRRCDTHEDEEAKCSCGWEKLKTKLTPS